MRYSFISLLLILAIQGGVLQSTQAQTALTSAKKLALTGRWRVKFTMGGVEKNLILISQPKGAAWFLLQDTGPDDKPVNTPAPASWTQLTNERVSFSGEAELPLGTCCREMGTLIFKGRFGSSHSISGKLIFVTSIDEDESPYKFRSMVGTFTATRVSNLDRIRTF